MSTHFQDEEQVTFYKYYLTYVQILSSGYNTL